MYCRKCYAELDAMVEDVRCPQCGRRFDPANAGTYLARPFPDTRKIILYILATSIVSVVVAFVVATFQLAAASGH